MPRRPPPRRSARGEPRTHPGALHNSTKAASLILYQSLAIEHLSVKFSFALATVEGDFRASAVDAGDVRQVDPKKDGLKLDVVARRCVGAVDNCEKTFLPPSMKLAPFQYWIWPTFVEERAKKMYNF